LKPNPSSAEAWLKRWIIHSFFYSLATSLPGSLYQAYAIRVLGYGIDDVGSLTFINIMAIALGNLAGLIIVYRYRRRRLTIWKTFTSLNLLLWSTSGFTDLTGLRGVFPLFIGLAQFTGSIGGLAYSDTIADVVPRERSIRVFGRVNVYTTMASLTSLISGATAFRLISDLTLAYRVCYTLSLASAVASMSLLLSLWSISERPSLGITLGSTVSKFREVMNREGVRYYVLFMALFTFSVNLPAALWNYYLIKVFKGDETWITMNNISNTLASMLGSYTVSRLHGRLEPRRVIIASTALISTMPSLYLLCHTLPMQIAFNTYTGFTWAFFNNMSNIYNLYLAGGEDRVYLLAVLGVFNNLAASTASKVGSSIASNGLVYMQLVFIFSSIGRFTSMIYAAKKLKGV